LLSFQVAMNSSIKAVEVAESAVVENADNAVGARE
jgi:hypothetical protein